MADDIDNAGKQLAPGIDPTWGVTVDELNYTPFEVKKYPNLHDYFADAAKDVDNVTTSIFKKANDKPILIRTTPGIGKTEAGTHLATMYAKIGTGVFISLPTRDMVWQIQERFKSGFFGQGHKIIVLEGRHNGYIRKRMNDKGHIDEIQVHPNCANYDKVARAAARGYPPGAFVCPACSLCPFHKNEHGEQTGIADSCQYYKTVYEAARLVKKTDEFGWAPIVLATHQMLASIVSDSELIKPEVIIVDEDWRPALREVFSWSRQEMGRLIKNADELAAFRKLLAKSMDLADKYRKQIEFPKSPEVEKDKSEVGKLLRESMTSSRIFGSYGVHGIALANFIKEAASQLGVDYAKVIGAAASADTGVNRGEYMTMGEHHDYFVPHYKETDLATDILTIIGEANAGKQKAYRISLRWDESSGWEYYWDYVRRSRFNGPSVFLDAYGSEILTQRVCDRDDVSDVEVLDVHCKMRSNVKVICYGSARTSRRAMDQDKDGLFDDYVDLILRKSKGKKILLYVQKCYVKWLEKRIKRGNYGLSSCIIKWFWQDRGDDSYGDYDKVILFGTPYSNIVAERHFANAMFYGEEPLDWSQGPDGVYLDERVRVHLEARQEKEMLQACFRIRPSKTQIEDKEQEIIIISAMKIDLHYEFPGANIRYLKSPQTDQDEVMKSVLAITKMVGGWTEMFSAFIFRENELAEWIKAGGSESDQEFMMTYDEIIAGMKRWYNHPFYSAAKGMLAFGMGMKFGNMTYRKKKSIWMCGNEDSVRRLLDELCVATGGPSASEAMEDDGIDETSPMIQAADSIPVEHVGKPRYNETDSDDNGLGGQFDEITNKAFIMAADEFEAQNPSGFWQESEAFVVRVREIDKVLRAAAKTGPPEPDKPPEPGGTPGTDGSPGPPDG